MRGRVCNLLLLLGTADYALVTSSLQNNDSLVTWTVIHMTAAKFKPLIFSVLGFALSSVANIFIFMILDDFCLLPAWFCYVIVNVRYWTAVSQSQSYITTDGQSVRAQSVRVRVTLQLTVSQSVCLGVEPNLGLLTRDLTYLFVFFFFEVTVLSFGGRPLTRGRVCHLSIFVNTVYSGQYLHKFLHSVLDTVYIYNI
jgi:hypothetical protein